MKTENGILKMPTGRTRKKVGRSTSFKKLCFQFSSDEMKVTPGKTSSPADSLRNNESSIGAETNLGFEPSAAKIRKKSSSEISLSPRVKTKIEIGLEDSNKSLDRRNLSADALLITVSVALPTDADLKKSNESYKRKLNSFGKWITEGTTSGGFMTKLITGDRSSSSPLLTATPSPPSSSPKVLNSFVEEHHSPVTGEDPQSMDREGQSRLGSSSVLLFHSFGEVADEKHREPALTSPSIFSMSPSSSSSSPSHSAPSSFSSSSSAAAEQMTLSSSRSSISAPVVSPRMTGKQLINNLDASAEANRELLFCLCSPSAPGYLGFSVVSVEAIGRDSIDRLQSVPMECLQRVRKLKVNTVNLSQKDTGPPLAFNRPSLEAITTDRGINVSTFLREMATTRESKILPSKSKDEIHSSVIRGFSSATADRIYSSKPDGEMDILAGGSQKRSENIGFHSTVGNKFPDNPIIGSIMAWIKGYRRVRCVDEKIPETARAGDLQAHSDNESIPNLRRVSAVIMALDEDRSINCFRFPGIKYLDLSGNSVEASDVQILVELMVDLKHLNLSNSGLKISQEFDEEQLKIARLHSRPIWSFLGMKESRRRKNGQNVKGNPEVMCSDPSINFRVFDLSRNSMKSWPFTLLQESPFCSVRQLTLSHNEIKHLPPYGVEELPRLKYLDLSHNHLEYLEVGSFTSKYLSHVDLSWNKLKVVGSMSFLYLPNLSELNLANNLMESIGKMAFYKVCGRDDNEGGHNLSQWKRKRVKIILNNNRLHLDSIWKWHAPFPGHNDKGHCPMLVQLKNNSMERLFSPETEQYFGDIASGYKSSVIRKICTSWKNLRLNLAENSIKCDCHLIRQMVILKRMLTKASYHSKEIWRRNEDLDWVLPDWKNYSCRSMNASHDFSQPNGAAVKVRLNEYFINSDCLERLCPLQDCSCTWNDFRLEVLNCSGRRLLGAGRNKRAHPDDRTPFSLQHSRFHLGILETVHTIDLSNNRIKSLKSLSFLEKCTHLQNLYLHSNLFHSIPDTLTKMSHLQSVTLKNNPVCCHCSSYQGRNLTNVLELLKDLENISCFENNPESGQNSQILTNYATSEIAISSLFLLKNPNALELSLAVALLLLTICAIVLTISSAIVYHRGTRICGAPQSHSLVNNSNEDHPQTTQRCSWIFEPPTSTSACPVFSSFIKKPIRLSSKFNLKTRMRLTISHEQLLQNGKRNSPTEPKTSLNSSRRFHGDRHNKVHPCSETTSKKGHIQMTFEDDGESNRSDQIQLASSSSSPPSSSSSSSPTIPSDLPPISDQFLRAFCVPGSREEIEIVANLPTWTSISGGSRQDRVSRSNQENLVVRFREVLRAINSQLAGRINNRVAAEQRILSKHFVEERF